MRHISSNTRGFTAVEMVIVVAIVGILAAIMVKVFYVIRENAQITRTYQDLVSLQKIVQSLELGVFPLTTGVGLSTSGSTGAALQSSSGIAYHQALRFDQVLLSMGKIKKLFDSSLVNRKIPTESVVGVPTAEYDPRWSSETGLFYNTPDTRVTHSWDLCARLECNANNPISIPELQTGENFWLYGTEPLPAGVRIVYAVLPSIPVSIANKLATMLNGESQTDSTTGLDGQNRGPAVFRYQTNGLTTLYVYLGHR